ncbi:hemerythrin domain-containing protein [Sulfurimonas sp. HSL-1656]|uniref:hemerythrin domain-containing protein n=1 Tax=Thiomicrolovo subterrani TaxID=3131934 RepID=UPI0031F7FB6E
MIMDEFKAEHRQCDSLYAEAERAVVGGDIERAEKLFGQFVEETVSHMEHEELRVFSRLEAEEQAGLDPIRFEHMQIRALLEKMQQLLAVGDFSTFLGWGESFMILMQQHNMKEEQLLYPLCDRLMAEDAEQDGIEIEGCCLRP